MKNKEIEKLLNNIKEDVKCNLYWKYICGYTVEDFKLLLSYIEQLEKRNKQLYEGFMATQEELTDYATKNEQLEKNRDKAIERCEFWLDFYRNVNNDERIILRLNDILSKLKGDSDE